MMIDLIAGARPNFMKVAGIINAIDIENRKGRNIRYRLVHTGQHYDHNMSGSFFEQLNIPQPDVHLGAGGGTQAEQTAAIMVGYEKLLMQKSSDLCLLVGDVTSTMACAISAKKMNIPVAHVEAGIRSGDCSMPEEINRIITDSISDFFFTTSEVANQNLRKNGISKEKIFFVGNTMIDTLLRFRHSFRKPDLWDRLNLQDKHFLIITLHRPSNVDNGEKLSMILQEIIKHSRNLPLIFPVHPRTATRITNPDAIHPRLHIVDPLSYFEFNYLVDHSTAVITDSGGISEETTVMGIPCLTLRNSTERPETVDLGTNMLIGTNPEAIAPALEKLFSGEWKRGYIPEKWDGKTSERIINHLLALQNQR